MKVVNKQLSKSNKTHLCPSLHLPAVLVFPGSGPGWGFLRKHSGARPCVSVGEASFSLISPHLGHWGFCTPDRKILADLPAWTVPMADVAPCFLLPRDAELPVVRAQRNRLCDLLGVPRPQLVPKVSPAPQATWGTWGPFLVRPPNTAP